MRPTPRRLIVTLALLSVVVWTAPPTTTEQASAERRSLELADIIAWKTISATTVSHDGQWFGYRLAPGEGDAQVVLRQTTGDREMKFDIGEPPTAQGGGGGGAPGAAPAANAPVQFSDDGKWAAFATYPTRAEARAAPAPAAAGREWRRDRESCQRRQARLHADSTFCVFW